MNTLNEIWEQYQKAHPAADKATFYAGAISVTNLLGRVATDDAKGREMAKTILQDMAAHSKAS